MTNKRYIPVGEGVLNNQKFNYEVYVKFVLMSKFNFDENERHRYIYEDEIIHTHIAKEIGISYSTYKEGLKYLMEQGYIKQMKVKDTSVYKIDTTMRGSFVKVGAEELDKLLNASTKNLIRIYMIYKKFNQMFGSSKINQKMVLENAGLKYCSSTVTRLREVNKTLESIGLVLIKRTRKKHNGKMITCLEVKTH